MTQLTLAQVNRTQPHQSIQLLAQMANRHGLIAGATGTGKTVTLKVLAEQFSNLGVPVFMADVKGDLSGLAHAGSMSDKLHNRLTELDMLAPDFNDFPCTFWDVFAEQGHPVRTTISEMGPLILSQLMGLNETQAGVLTVAFRVADDQGMLLLDLKDLRAMLQFVADNARDLRTQYGNISAASVGAIQRRLLTLEDQGAEQFFGEPALNIADLMQTDANGKGMINILAADKLMHSPKLYACLLLWMLSELFETLPEVGDPKQPKLVFFFDEAHLLFDDAEDALQDKIEQVVRLIRSKGVGIYFVSQSPSDIPESVLGQLGNRIQHALRAFTPKDQKAVRTAAQTFRPNPAIDVEAAITELSVGEALISVLDDKGTPMPVERAWVFAPASQFAPISPEQRQQIMQNSLVAGVYDTALDRESAYELLIEKAQAMAQAKLVAEQQAELEKQQAAAEKQRQKEEAAKAKAEAREEARRDREMDKLKNRVIGAFATSAARQLGGRTGSKLVRGILGSLFK